MRRLMPWATAGILGVLATSSWAVLLQVARQQGRMLMRLDELEQRLQAVESTRVTGVPAPANGTHLVPPGLLVGLAFPPYQLPDLDGKLVDSAEFRGRRVLLVHWDPACRFCDVVAPTLAKLQPALAKRGVELLLVSHGEAATNRDLAKRHGLTARILLQDPHQPVEVLRTLGTPVAYLLDEQGHVAQPLALGVEQVEALATEAAGTLMRLPGQRPLSDSRLMRDGLRAGSPAPDFSLPDVGGVSVSLRDYRGKRVLVVFSDPSCGPCTALAPRLAQLHRDLGDRLQLIMISRGDVGENRRKAAEAGITFPVLIQPQWSVSRQFGIFATPVAFLIDEQGTIVRDVARGPEAIVALAATAVNRSASSPAS